MNTQSFINGVWRDDPDQIVSRLRTMGKYSGKLIRVSGDVEDFECNNICTMQGLISLLNNQFTGATQITNWYLGLFQNNYTPVGGDTASSFPTSAGEFTGYSGGARPAFQPQAATSSPTINNSSSVATFTFTGAATIYGAFLTSVATLGSGSGILFSAAQFAASKTVSSGDQLLLTYALTAATA